MDSQGDPIGQSDCKIPFPLFQKMVMLNRQKNFNSYCGAEWLMGHKVIKTFMGLIITIVISVSLFVGLGVFTVCLNGKLNSLKQKMKIDKEIDDIRESVECEAIQDRLVDGGHLG